MLKTFALSLSGDGRETPPMTPCIAVSPFSRRYRFQPQPVLYIDKRDQVGLYGKTAVPLRFSVSSSFRVVDSYKWAGGRVDYTTVVVVGRRRRCRAIFGSPNFRLA